jgi:hypothetical protein
MGLVILGGIIGFERICAFDDTPTKESARTSVDFNIEIFLTIHRITV